uniref:Tyrosine specific protein phosphatases domain-containing protein n=1 Tax=viral metagenome TaxID=1070528 RepID=A0A6C0H7A1_9ZZZZ
MPDQKKKKSPKRTRRTDHKMTVADYIRKHSPIKAGLRISDEDKPLAKYNKVMDRMYLGNYQAAKDRDLFKDKKITAVLNCTRDIPNHFAHNKDIEYMRIPVEDSLKEKDFELMYQYMPCIVEFIHKHANIEKNNILVHCWAGRQRSAISIAAYLVAKHGLNPHDACKLILEKRPEAFHFGHSLNFDQALTKFYKTHAKKAK